MLLIVALVMVPALTFLNANKLLQKFSCTLPALGVTLKLIWSLLDGSVRALKPWAILMKRNAPAAVLNLDYTATPVYVLPFQAFSHRHYLVTFVGVVSLLAEVLVVCLSSFGLKGTAFLHRKMATDGSIQRDIDDVETFASFWFSFITLIVILIAMLLASSLVFYARHWLRLPRAPGTIASVMAYAHQGKILMMPNRYRKAYNARTLEISREARD